MMYGRLFCLLACLLHSVWKELVSWVRWKGLVLIANGGLSPADGRGMPCSELVGKGGTGSKSAKTLSIHPRTYFDN